MSRIGTDGRCPGCNPRIGDVVNHRDGGQMYVVNTSVKPRQVKIVRRPDWKGAGEQPLWISIERFRKEAV